MVTKVLKDIERGKIKRGDIVMDIAGGQLKRYIDFGLVQSRNDDKLVISDIADSFESKEIYINRAMKLGEMNISKMHKIQRRLRNAENVDEGIQKKLVDNDD